MNDKLVEYSVVVYDPSKYKREVYVGKRNGIRKCRFCGRTLDKSKYSKVAHAISVTLGNVKFFCADECDECNERFGQRIENDMTNFFQVHLSLYQVPKRDGKTRKIVGRNFDMQMSNDSNPFNNLPILRIQMKDWKNQEISVENIGNLLHDLDLTNKTYVPQNIYKGICKYALSLTPESILSHYKKTIEWINSDNFEKTVPIVKSAYIDRAGNEPIMYLFIRKSDNNAYPLLVAFLCVANAHFLYLLPFCDESDSVEEDNERLNTFLTVLKESLHINDCYENCDLSNTERIGFHFIFDLKFEPGATAFLCKKDIATGQYIIENNSK